MADRTPEGAAIRCAADVDREGESDHWCWVRTLSVSLLSRFSLKESKNFCFLVNSNLKICHLPLQREESQPFANGSCVTRWMSEGCVGNVGSIPRLNFPSLCMQDSPLGVRMSTSIFP